jgi:hypothetical protein
MNSGRAMGAVGRWAVRPVGWWVVLAAAVGTGLMAWVSRVPVHGVSKWFVDWSDSVRVVDWGKSWEQGEWREVIYSLGVLVWLGVVLAWWGGAVVRSVALLFFPAGAPYRRGWARYAGMWLMFVVTVAIAGVGWPYRMGEAMVARDLWAEKHTKAWMGGRTWKWEETGEEPAALWEAALRGAEARERLAAFRMLIEEYPEFAPRVLDDALARERDPVMKAWELRLVGVYRARDACDRVGKFLDDADGGVRAAAADALGLLYGADPNGELRRETFGGAWPTTVSDPPIGLPGARRDEELPLSPTPPMAEMPEAWRARLRKMMVEGATAGERLAAARAAAGYGPKGYRLRLAEWGVWSAGKDAEGGRLRAVLAEVPGFVHATGDDLAQLFRQANATAGLRRVATPMLIRKPVVHLTTNVPLSVELHVSFQYGRPWYAYPMPDAYSASPYSQRYVAGELSPGDLGALGTKLSPGYEWLVPSRAPVVSAEGRPGSLTGLCWQNLIVSPQRLGWMKPAEVGAGEGHAWWRRLREVECSWVSNREESERFVYYDGPTALRCPVRFVWEGGRLMVWPARLSWRDVTFLQVPPVELEKTRAGLLVQVKGGRATAQWVTIPLTSNSLDRIVPRVISGTEVRGTAEGAFSTRLTERGLTDSEKRGMVEAWRHAFFEREGVRLLMFLSTLDYERFCPMKVKPAATQVVRVGVVWVEL